MSSLNSIQSSNATQQHSTFDPTSKGYEAVTYAAKGQLEKLRELNNSHPETKNQLVQVTEQDYYTPLHYALASNQWEAAAYLINEGVDWAVSSKRGNNKEGTTAISRLNIKELSLCHLIEGLIKLDKIDVDHLVKLLTSEHLSVERRREVLKDHPLCHALASRLAKDEKLFVMASLMIGSFSWYGVQTDFPHLSNGKYLDFHNKINCSQLVLYASYLSGEKQVEEIHEKLVQNAPPTNPEIHKLITNPLTPPKIRDKFVLPIQLTYSSNMGLTDKNPAKRIKPQNIHKIPSKIQVLYMVQPNEIVEHYGLIYRLEEKKSLLIHITKDTQTVACEDAEIALKDYVRQNNVVIYSSMLPWHSL